MLQNGGKLQSVEQEEKKKFFLSLLESLEWDKK
jgi:hypothetical protein